MATHVSVGYIRNSYNPPESNATIIHDFSEDGRPRATFYLGTGRRVLYKYGKLGKLSEVLYDATAVTFGYDEMTGVLKMVNLQSGGFSCTIRYRKLGPLVDKQMYRFSEEGMVNARFDYTYHDNSFRVASIKPVIGETPLPVDLYRYDEISGKIEHFGKFGIIYYDINQIITTAVMTLSKHFDAHGRIKEVQYEIFRSLMYWMTVQYDSMGRVIKRELKIGPYANTTQYRYEYDGDGQLVGVKVDDWSTWRYSYDLNGNLHLLNPGNSARLLPLRYDLRDRITRLGDMQYQLDEDGVLAQRGSDIFEYNSKGLLERAYSRTAGGWSVRYRYDGLGRRVSRRTNEGRASAVFLRRLVLPHTGDSCLQPLESWNHLLLLWPAGSSICYGGQWWGRILHRLWQRRHSAGPLQQQWADGQADAVHGVWRDLPWFQPGFPAHIGLSRRALWSSHKAGAFRPERLRRAGRKMDRTWPYIVAEDRQRACSIQPVYV